MKKLMQVLAVFCGTFTWADSNHITGTSSDVPTLKIPLIFPAN